jgi:hypothetical protein
MLQRLQFGERRRLSRYALVVLGTVFSLTVNLATRYGSFCGATDHGIKVIQAHVTSDAKRQRLADSADTWMPPRFSFSILRVPGFCSPTALGESAPHLLLEASLYTRPPPVG